MALRKDKSVFRKQMSAWTDAMKGSLIGTIGNDVGPKVPDSNKNSYSQVNPNAVRGKRHK